MDAWKSDDNLKTRLNELVTQSFQQKESLVFIANEFPMYNWSLRTLQRRLKYFGIFHNDQSVAPDDLLTAVKDELNGPGILLGYRALHQKIRNNHGLLVKSYRQDVHYAMNILCPEKLEERRVIGCRQKFHRREFRSKGSNWLWSLDGHDKLMGRCKSEFPLAIHGCIDSFARKILWLKIWPSNSHPDLPAKLYYDAIMEHGCVPNLLRSDRGNENSIITAMHDLLHDSPLGQSKHLYGSSTTNQVIEQWWCGLRERQGEYFKNIVIKLAKTHYYHERNETCRVILAFVFIGLIQENLDAFKENWNTHRIRRQDIYRPCGIPNFLYKFPKDNGGEECGMTPDPDVMEYIENKNRNLEQLRFLAEETEQEMNFILAENGDTKIVSENVIACYALLLDAFNGRVLQFNYS